jgi:RecB family exonuclease
MAARDLHLAEALVATAAEASELEPRPSAAEIVGATRGRPRMVGDPEGVSVTGYPQAAGLGRSHLVLTGLAADRWPPPLHPTAFASPELIAKAPGLGPRDRQAEFAACLCAADTAVLVRQARDGFGRERAPSVFWVAAEAAGATPRPSPEAAHTRPPKRVLLQAEFLSERARIAVAERRRFSVEELGSYLRCPRGWFAEYVLPGPPADPEASKGEAVHAALAAAFHPKLSEEIGREMRADIARDVLDERARAGEISAADALVLLGRCRGVIDRYSPPGWPFRTVAVERNCALLSKDRATIITGRIDRLDEDEHGAIVIDYKLNREPKVQSFGALVRDPQATLYSLMVARRLKLEPLGVLFVSLSHAEHDGLVSAEHQAWGPLARREADLLWKKGSAEVMGAIEGMRAGRIERSQYCRRECPCRRLSWDQA